MIIQIPFHHYCKESVHKTYPKEGRDSINSNDDD